MNEAPSLRARVHWWLERPDPLAIGPRLLEIALILLITANVIAVVLETVDTVHGRWREVFAAFETLSVAIFVVEYAARLWCAPENPEIRSRLRWALTPLALVDLLAILPSVLAHFVAADLRILRAFRLLRVLKLTRYSAALSMLLTVFEEEAGSFFAAFFILSLMLVVAAFGGWLAEREAQPEAFGSIPAAMWWAVATLTTVGYGDVTPVTAAGKLFGAMIAIVGIGMAALPAGILASGLTDLLRERREEQNRQFRKAFEDGAVRSDREDEIEALRRRLGVSRRAARSIRSTLERPHGARCPHCGKALPE